MNPKNYDKIYVHANGLNYVQTISNILIELSYKSYDSFSENLVRRRVDGGI